MYIKSSTLSKILLSLIGFVLICLGMGMIIMPAPPYFERFTLLHFKTDDGITLLDIISLLITLAGVYLLITQFKDYLSSPQDPTESINTRIFNIIEVAANEKNRSAASSATTSKNDMEILLLNFDLILTDIRSYTKKLERNSIVNLLIGIISASISILVLSLSILHTPAVKIVSEFIIIFLPKISLVLVFQIVSFFFLRLYKTNQEDSKYFQNELTNVLSQRAAIVTAIKFSDTDTLNFIIRHLGLTERNFKIGSNESLPAIEKIKAENEHDKNTIQLICELIKSINNKG